MTEQRHAALALHSAEPSNEHIELLKRRQILRRTQIAAVVVLLLLGLGAGRTVLTRQANAKALETSTTENARQYVKVAQPKRAAAGQMLTLPGTLQGQVQTPISARASGYLKRWTSDIGSNVKQGQLLAEIESPEIDQQLAQAIAGRDQQAANLALARSTAERWEGLRKKDVVSQQDLDERRSSAAQAQANLDAAEANVQRLRQLESFKRVLAPFAGVVTRRNVDVGDLIDPSRPLFTLAQVDKLRVFINVPQAYAQLVKPGQPVTISQAELRGLRFAGRVVRSAGAIDAATRTLQVEVNLVNPERVLLPGAYVQVALPLQASAALLVPTNTLLFRAEGSLVGVVDKQGKVKLKPVTVGRNYGAEVELLDGVAEADRLVMNPPDWLADGLTVVVAPNAPAKSASGASAPAAPLAASKGKA
jgi:RND family efflux transporter MFP subunit